MLTVTILTTSEELMPLFTNNDVEEVQAQIERWIKLHYPKLNNRVGYKLVCEEMLARNDDNLDTACYQASIKIDEFIENTRYQMATFLGKKPVTFDMEDVE
jgi:hypothetical protein